MSGASLKLLEYAQNKCRLTIGPVMAAPTGMHIVSSSLLVWRR